MNKALLSDDQIREFITNGFLILNCENQEILHKIIKDKLEYFYNTESWLGNNVMARIPELWNIIGSNIVKGAVASILGPEYVLHPHRAVHTSEPIDDKTITYSAQQDAPQMGSGSQAGSAWHQDAHSPLARARHHFPRYLIGFYFPHYTPPEMGPTRIYAGSQFYSKPLVPSKKFSLLGFESGSFVLAHFDIVHAAFPNQTDQTRFMIKFVFARTKQQVAPTWNHIDENWNTPKNLCSQYNLESAWKASWFWLQGKETSSKYLGSIKNLNSADQCLRVNAIYRAAHKGNIARLTRKIEKLAEKQFHQRKLAKNEKGRNIPMDLQDGWERRWNERAVLFDDSAYTLGTIGIEAVPELINHLSHSDPWVVLNMIFALGEIGAEAEAAKPELVNLLNSSEQVVVRQTLDTLSSIGGNLDLAIKPIEKIFSTKNEKWCDPLVLRGWNAQEQIEVNSAFLLLSAVDGQTNQSALENLLKKVLSCSNGYASNIATEALRRIGTKSALESSVKFLQNHFWDDNLNKEKQY